MKINYINTSKDLQYYLMCERICNPKPSYDNPIQLYFESNKSELYEGLISSYPYETVKKYIIKYLNLDPDFIKDSKDEYGYPEMIILSPAEPDVVKKIKDVLDVCGYYNSMAIPINREYLDLHFLPKYRKENEIDVKSIYPVLYHVTKTKRVDKILKQGLVPKSKNDAFNYPDRIHLMIGPRNPMIVKSFGWSLYSKSKDKSDSKYTILEIDTSKLPDNIKFYGDPDYAKGLYTLDNIPPECITATENFDARAYIF